MRRTIPGSKSIGPIGLGDVQGQGQWKKRANSDHVKGSSKRTHLNAQALQISAYVSHNLKGLYMGLL